MTNEEALELIRGGERIDVEFKSDRGPLKDDDLVNAIVALANTDGGTLFLGVEDDGSVTGLNPRHSDTDGIVGLVVNKTHPGISVVAERLEIDGRTVAAIVVPMSRELVSTSSGTLLKRRMKADGTPEAAPFYPSDFTSRRSSLHLVDPSMFVVEGVDASELDPLQRARLRRVLRGYNGEKSLAELSDEELDGALSLVAVRDGRRVPTVAGVLLLGTEALIRRHVPSHEVCFQCLKGTEVRKNESYRLPLLEVFEKVTSEFDAVYSEEEVSDGLFRVPVPNYDRQAFREAFVNALVHRDYSRLGMVQVKVEDDGITISSPGDFVEGVTVGNLLVTPPSSRNPALADVLKRIGLAERTGRGIDRIYQGLLRYGRPAPDYTSSSGGFVSVFISSEKADVAFLKMVVGLETSTDGLRLDELLVLAKLREGRRLCLPDLVEFVQRGETKVRAVVEKLVERGLIDATGSGRARSYSLDAGYYAESGMHAEYVRLAGFTPIQQRQMVISLLKQKGSIVSKDVENLCRISRNQARYLLQRMNSESKIICDRSARPFRYTLGHHAG